MFKTVFFIFLFIAVTTAAQQQPITANQQIFTVEDGLPQSFVTGILQDKNGFIWISTSDGLARYDGRSFRVFYKKRNDPSSFRSNVIGKMIRNGNDHFILVFEGGEVADFDPVTFKIKNIASRAQLKETVLPLFANTVYKNNFTNFFFFNGIGKGIKWIDPVTSTISYAGRANGKLKSDTISGLVQDSAGTLFILTPEGVDLSKNEGKTFEHIPFKIPDEATGGYFRDILVMPDKSFVKMNDNKLFFIDPIRKKSSVITLPRGNKAIRVANIMNLDAEGRLYVEMEGRIFRLEKNGSLKVLWENTINPNLRITSCFIDRNEVLWVSVDAQGLVKVNLRTAPFQSYKYSNGFFADVYVRAGIPKTKLPKAWLIDQGVAYHYYHAYAKDSTLFLYHTTVENIKTDIAYWKDQTFTPLPFPANKKSISRGIVADNNGEIWAADMQNKGLWFWKNKESNPQFFLFDTSKDYTINNTEIADMELLDDEIWISTHGKGLFLFKKGIMQKDFKKRYDPTLLPNNLTDICADPGNKDQLWIGSRGEGLILFNKKSGLKRIFSTDDGLPNNTIYCIAADQSGILWLSTNKGICRFDPKNFSSTSYVKSDGLAGNEFNRYHKFVFLDGRIAFGGLDGYSIFNPNDFTGKKNSLPITMQITRIYINNEEQDFTASTSLVRQPFSELKELKLPYNKNYLSVEFAALQFNEPLKIRYRYMLKGADKTWRESGFNNVASYTQLRPGRYTLLMNASSLDGVWSDSVLQLPVIIHPPFWATWWAYLIYILIAAAVIRYYFIYQKKRLKEQQQLVFERKEAERLKEMDEVKDRFFSNVTHEFRTPLTLILTPLEKLQQDGSLPVKATSLINTIYSNTRQLLRLINEFLDFSKLNKGQMKLNLSNGDLALFVAAMVKQFESKAEEKNIHFSFLAEGVEGLYLFDEEKWEKIIFNLVNNALKFTPEEGSITVSLVKNSNDHVQLTVTDTGIGIPADQLPKIFERFYQVDASATRHYGGTGIGLSLVKELTELMKGEIKTQSSPGMGSTFTLTIPVTSVHPAPETTEGMLSKNPMSIGSDALPKSVLNESNDEKPLILVVEDNMELQSFLVESLSDQWRIITASDGLQAWEMIMTEIPDVVISDVMMPGRDGFELCKLCKNDSRTSHIGFILLTSRAAHTIKLQGLELGADDYITKPFHLDELKLRTNNLLYLQQKQRKFLQSQVLPANPAEIVPKVSDTFIQQLYKLLDDNIIEPQMSVDYIAKNMSMSRSSLNRKLKTLLDISTNDLIRRYRLQKATSLLAAGNDITTTTYEVGFNTPSYFTQCFKEQYGITPSEYIASIR